MNPRNKIKVLHILPSLSLGGAERLVLDLLSNFSADIFSTQLLLFKDKGFFYQEAIDKKIEVVTLSKKSKFDPINFIKIYLAIKKFSPDIVHTHLGADVYGGLAAKLAGVKNIVSTEHNVLANNTSCYNFIKKIISKLFSRIIAVSSTIKEELSTKFNLSADKVILLRNGVDVDKFKAYKKNKISDKIIFGSIGRLSPQKNYSLLINAVAQIKGDNFKFKIAGVGPLESELKQQIQTLGLLDKVELVGPITDVGNFLSQLDFFVLPSKWEGLGLVLLEAGLLGLPVLASSTGGILDIILDHETGILFKNNNCVDLVEKINYFLDPKNQSELKLLGVALSNLVSREFSIKNIANKYEALYLALVK